MKVKGFTTLELSVAMVLGALVTGIGYSGYTMFLNQLKRYNKNLDEISDFRNLQSLLYRDFYLCRSIEKGDESILLNYDNKTQTSYSWDNGYMIREQTEVRDTFKFAVLDATVAFQHQDQFIPGGKIDFFEVELEFNKQPLVI